jgi:excisionase family DNA binding protein
LNPDDRQEHQRRKLLAALFGTAVPSSLGGQLLRTSDVATLFQVSERTVSEWARRNRIPSVRTPGGHRRYPADQIRILLEEAEAGRGPTVDGVDAPLRPPSVGRLHRPRGATG